MTVNNNNIRYKIEVEDVESHTLRLPSTITANFIVNEIVTGVSSGATAVVTVATALPDLFIEIRNKDGFFFENEDLTGSMSGVAEKTGGTETLSTPYTNATFDISSGTWTLLSDGDLLTKMSDATQKINIAKGGNLGTGYGFNFEVTNFEFAKAILQDGVYFKHRKITLFVGFVVAAVTTFTEEWTGIIDTFTEIDDGVMGFRCTDATKSNIENVGSDLVPIALNRNYNCKLPKAGEERTDYIVRDEGGVFLDTFVSFVDTNKGFIDAFAYTTGNWFANFATRFNNGFIEITAGQGSGGIFKIRDVEVLVVGGNQISFRIYLNDDLSSLLPHLPGAILLNLSMFRIFSVISTFNLSKRAVNNIHIDENSLIEKPFALINENNSITLSNPEDYTDSISAASVQEINVSSIDNNGDIESNALIKITPLQLTPIVYVNTPTAFFTVVELHLDNSNLEILTNLVNNNDDVYIYVGKLTFPGASTVGFTVATQEFNLSLNGNYHNSIVPGGSIELMNFSEIGVAPDDAVMDIGQSGTDITFDFRIGTDKNINDFLVSNYNKSGPLSKATLRLQIRFTYLTPDTKGTPASITLEDFGFKTLNSFTIDKRSIGCDGENVLASNGFENVPDTIQYLLENEYEKVTADIDTASFTQAQADFALYVDDPPRNAAHQIVSQNSGNELLKEILFNHNLGMYIGRNGQYRLVNWLPKSIVFGSTATSIDYTETEFESISKITRDILNNVISDYELPFNLNESTGEFDNTIRIKNTNESTFDFDRDTEGVDISDSGLAFSAWALLQSGFNRVTNLTQTKKESKWIKLFNSNNTGTTEAIAFIRNIAAHVNRQHEYLTIVLPYNATNLSQELLSFISVEDIKITDGQQRKGWIVERKLNIKADKLEFRVLLDINPFDPFLFRVNKWSDGNFVSNTKTTGAFSSNTKTNGIGI